ncbi:ankyrin repeat domain-containing protein [Singulisphaera sp. Ch08]|uniref:Ankyrin repeat domain-containing protein n=1 Tax=Singulisphaera sp. Ch08 TaxID=3120278 RepID=A0AAU7CGV6_9BACT
MDSFTASASETGTSVLGVAAKSARLETIKALIEAGADAGHVDPNGYSILVNAVYRTVNETVDEHLAVLEYLIASGAPLDVASKYGESVLNVLSSRGEFAKVKFLLDQGANPEPLGWTPLFFAVAFGRMPEVRALLDQGASLDERDRGMRTPFLLSVHAGHQRISEMLLESGSDRSVTGHCGHTALMDAVARDDVAMMNWLISQGWDVEAADDFGNFPLNVAVQHNALACVAGLLRAGASASRRNESGTGVMSEATTPEMVNLLVAAGEELSEIDPAMRSRLTGIEPSEEIQVSEVEYREFRNRRFGQRNPDRMNNPYWESMVRTRVWAYAATSKFSDSSFGQDPAWCFKRFGQSITRLPDGRYVEIAGEHEDFYDPDFCIYNDVVIHHGDGTFDILGYPEHVFPPTDFHSATYQAPYLYLIGNLGYPQERQPGETPIFRLHCDLWTIERIQSHGENPGWIHSHKARLITENQIEIRGGSVITGAEREMIDNESTFILDLSTMIWQKDATIRGE